MLEYEEALTRSLPVAGQNKYYNSSAHFLWIGDRTRHIDGAHIEYFRGIRNPIGLKAGPTLSADELVRLLDILDPDFEDGKVTIICRYGASKVEECLPAHIKAVQGTKHKPVFCADIMHGNTVSAGKYKTRHMADMVSELSKSFQIHLANGSKLQGVHLEMTGDVDKDGFSVTECLGGSMELEVEELAKRYQSHCDPRLNTEQTLGESGSNAVARLLTSRHRYRFPCCRLPDQRKERAEDRELHSFIVNFARTISSEVAVYALSRRPSAQAKHIEHCLVVQPLALTI